MVRQSPYNAVWRWHFYAGLLVMPFLVLLALTGGAYLFQKQITNIVYHDWETVIPATRPLPAAMLAARVEQASGGHVLQLTPPTAPDQAWLMTLRLPDGRARWAFVDPADGHITGATRYGGVMQLVRKIHSLQVAGFWASCLIEIAAGWSIILVGSGLYLWWPRGRSGGVLTIRTTPRRRVFWRDLHAVTGALTGAIILFLAVTGMPWSQVWGSKVQQWTTARGWGDPKPPAETVPTWLLTQDLPAGMARTQSHPPHEEAPSALPWALQQAGAPASIQDGRPQIGIDRAIALLRARHLAAPFVLTLPGGPRGAYVGTSSPDKVEDLRTLYLDQYSGALLGDVRFKDLGPAARAIQWGIQVHQGQEYGPLNKYLMLAGCLAILLLAVSSLIMWWKRRPSGALGIPPAPANPAYARAVLCVMIPVALIYPLVGASLLAALAIDAILTRVFVA